MQRECEQTIEFAKSDHEDLPITLDGEITVSMWSNVAANDEDIAETVDVVASNLESAIEETLDELDLDASPAAKMHGGRR